MNRPATFVVTLAFASLAVGCASAPPPEPTLDLSSRSCTIKPELQRAFVLSFEKETDHTTSIDDTAPCILVGPSEARSAYSIFGLPPSEVPYIAGVTSTPIGQGLFSPHLLTLDAAGTVLRELPRDAFQFHGSTLYAALRVRPTERYLIVASDPQSVGHTESQISSAVHVGVVPAGVVVFAVYTGSEATNQLTYAHNGKVTVELKTLKP